MEVDLAACKTTVLYVTRGPLCSLTDGLCVCGRKAAVQYGIVDLRIPCTKATMRTPDLRPNSASGVTCK